MIPMTLLSGKGRKSEELLLDKWLLDLVWLSVFCGGLESENPLEAESTSSRRIFTVGLHNLHLYMW
jgi:hypothetical protein